MLAKNILLIILIFITQNLFSQTITSEKLIKLKITDSGISIVDSVGEITPSYGDSYYYSIVSAYDINFIFHYERYIYITPYDKEELKIFNENTKQFITFRDVVLPDDEFIAPYIIHRPFTEQVEHGKWIIHGEYRNFFISDDGYLRFIYKAANGTDSSRLFSIPGKVGDKYLISVEDKNQQNKYLYYLTDINTPNLNINSADQVTFEDDSVPLRLKLLKDNYYIVHAMSTDRSRELSIYQFADNKFKFFMKVTDYGDWFYAFNSKWNIINSTFYLVDNNSFKSYVLNPAGTGFVKTVLFDSIDEENFGIDSDFRIAAYIKDNFLKVYHVSDMRLIDSISLSGISNAVRPIVDSPYVYVHQYNTATGVEEKNNSTIKEYTLSAYPNPFNPVTTISFSLPYAQNVELKVYDILGKEVSVLVNEFLNAGKHDIKFDAGKFTSGVYFYQLSAGGKIIQTKKLILLR